MSPGRRGHRRRGRDRLGHLRRPRGATGGTSSRCDRRPVERPGRAPDRSRRRAGGQQRARGATAGSTRSCNNAARAALQAAARHDRRGMGRRRGGQHPRRLRLHQGASTASSVETHGSVVSVSSVHANATSHSISAYAADEGRPRQPSRERQPWRWPRWGCASTPCCRAPSRHRRCAPGFSRRADAEQHADRADADEADRSTRATSPRRSRSSSTASGRRFITGPGAGGGRWRAGAAVELSSPGR